MKTMRKDNRTDNDTRPLKLTPDYVSNIPGSVMVALGRTRVLCSATIEYKVPHFLKEEKKGWINAEYSMLPGSTGDRRVPRERNRINGRNMEIQRFISRALRNTFDLKEIEGITIHIDCDVIEADGSTRCASLNGAMVVLRKALDYLVFENKIAYLPKLEYIAAVSVGIRKDRILTDLTYEEDASADADINIISSESGQIIEVSAFAEENPVPRDRFDQAMDLGIEKNREIIELLKKQSGDLV